MLNCVIQTQWIFDWFGGKLWSYNCSSECALVGQIVPLEGHGPWTRWPLWHRQILKKLAAEQHILPLRRIRAAHSLLTTVSSRRFKVKGETNWELDRQLYHVKWFPKCCPWNSSVSFTWELVRNANIQTLPQTYCIRNSKSEVQQSVLISPPGGSSAGQNWGNTGIVANTVLRVEYFLQNWCGNLMSNMLVSRGGAFKRWLDLKGSVLINGLSHSWINGLMD